MGQSDGSVIGSAKILDNGPDSERFNLVFVSEGFMSSELQHYAEEVEEFIDFLFSTPPFDELRCAFNIYRIDVSSTDSGADDPALCGGDGSLKATRFDASFCNGGIRRLLRVNNAEVISVAGSIIAGWHQIIVIVNSSVYGGSGGSVAVTSLGGRWKEVALHEMGHSVFDLADEYPSWAGCSIDTNRNYYPGGEPPYVNVTVNTNRSTVKWKDLILSGTPVPTTINGDCTKCDTQPDPCPAGTVGLYEGAYYYHCGVFRPEFNCMMRNLDSFCAVCKKRIRDVLSVFVEECYAPVFRPLPLILCFILKIILVIVIAVLIFISLFTDKYTCCLKKMRFVSANCSSGNDDPCFTL